MALIDALRAFLSKVDVTDAEVKQAESIDNLSLSLKRPVVRLLQAVRADYEALTKSLGKSINISINQNDVPVVRVSNGKLGRDFDAQLKALSELPHELLLELRMEIDKKAVIGLLFPKATDYNVLYYFDEERAITLLRAGLEVQDERVFRGVYTPTVIVISGVSYLFEGRLFVLTGEGSLDSVKRSLVLSDARTRNVIDRFHSFAAENLNWSNFHFQHLTPIHYLGNWKKGTQPDVQATFIRHTIHLAIIYTATRTNYSINSFQSAYSNTERTVAIKLGSETGESRSIDQLTRLVLWPSSGKGADHLTIFQNVVTREIDEGDSAANYIRFVNRIPELLREARWHHRLFINEKIKGHFDEVQRITEYGSQVSTQITESIDNITKGLSETLLATVGVIIASLLAALVEGKTQGAIFQIGMRIYAVYIVLLLVFRMGSIYHSYSLLNRDVNNRLDFFAERIGKVRVEAIAKPLNSRRQQFQFWFSTTVLSYVVLAVLIWTASTVLPGVLVSQGIIAPPTTVTATIPLSATTTPVTFTPTPIPTAPPTSTPATSSTPLTSTPTVIPTTQSP